MTLALSELPPKMDVSSGCIRWVTTISAVEKYHNSTSVEVFRLGNETSRFEYLEFFFKLECAFRHITKGLLRRCENKQMYSGLFQGFLRSVVRDTCRACMRLAFESPRWLCETEREAGANAIKGVDLELIGLVVRSFTKHDFHSRALTSLLIQSPPLR